MAQLIKIQDYVSRYQIDMNRYPAQFIRMKKSGWERVKTQWDMGELVQKWEHLNESEDIKAEPKKKSSLFLKLFNVNKSKEEIDATNKTFNELNEDERLPDDETTLYFEPNIVYNPTTLEELKRLFIDQFFHFQLKWASSTLREKSYVDTKFLRDNFLKTILQSLPDNYLVLYYPIVQLKKAPVELDVIILTPLECLCITVVESHNLAVYVGNSERERFWNKKIGIEEKKVLNPLIQLNRMESIVAQLFSTAGVDMPIRKVLLTRNSYIDYPGTLYKVQIIDSRNYENWFQNLKHTTSPMKHMQILAAKTLLNSVQTTSYNRTL